MIPHHLKSKMILFITHFVVMKTVMRITSVKVQRQLNKRVKDCNGRDRNSHLFKHSVESRHDPVLKIDFRIIRKGYGNNTRRRKTAEALFIKKVKASLNIQENSVKLEFM